MHTIHGGDFPAERMGSEPLQLFFSIMYKKMQENAYEMILFLLDKAGIGTY